MALGGSRDEEPKVMEEPRADGVLEVFFSYSHKDDRFRQEIDSHLSMLKRQELISNWFDHEIIAGKDLDEEIAGHLERARIILLLVSSDFIRSDYCYCKELGRAIERHRAKSARVIPIIVRPCDWLSAPFGKLKALPKDGKAITDHRRHDKAYLDIAQGIRKVVDELNAVRKSPPTIEDDGRSEAAPDDDKVTLSASLGVTGGFELLQRIGCPCLWLKLVCTSRRPAKIRGAELRIRGHHHIRAFQEGFGTDFGYKPPRGQPDPNDSLGWGFIPASPPTSERVEKAIYRAS